MGWYVGMVSVVNVMDRMKTVLEGALEGRLPQRSFIMPGTGNQAAHIRMLMIPLNGQVVKKHEGTGTRLIKNKSKNLVRK